MKLLNCEYIEQTSQGIYCNITYKNIFGKQKTRQSFLYIFNDGVYSPFPKWVDNGKGIFGLFFYEAMQKEMIRQYEKRVKN